MSVVKDHLRLLEYTNMLIIVSSPSKATKAKMLKMLNDLRINPFNIVEIWPPATAKK
jgi:hypothetical protein